MPYPQRAPREFPRPAGITPRPFGNVPGRREYLPGRLGTSPAGGDIPGLWRGHSRPARGYCRQGGWISPPRALAVFIYQPCDRFKEFAAYSVGLASAPARKQTSRRHRSITDQDPDQGKFAAPISIQSDSSHRRSDGRRRRSSVTDRGGGCAQRAGGNGTRTAHMHIAAHRAYARTASTAGIKCALQHTHGVLTPPQAATRGHLVRRSERRHEHGVLASADPAQRHDTPAMPVMPGRSALDVGMDVAGLVHVPGCMGGVCRGVGCV